MQELLELLKGARKIAQRYYEGEGMVFHYLLPNGIVLEIIRKD
jgi:hypothetical protein